MSGMLWWEAKYERRKGMELGRKGRGREEYCVCDAWYSVSTNEGKNNDQISLLPFAVQSGRKVRKHGDVVRNVCGALRSRVAVGASSHSEDSRQDVPSRSGKRMSLMG